MQTVALTSTDDTYHAVRLIGSGTFGSVILCRRGTEGDGAEVAVKRVTIGFVDRTKQAEDGLSDIDANRGGREASICHALKKASGGRYIVQLLDDFLTYEDAMSTRRRRGPGSGPADKGSPRVFISRNLVFDMHGVSLEAVLRARRDGTLRLPRGTTWEDLVCELVIGTAEALAFLHSHSVTHRDLKPANVLVDPASLEVRLCDLGSAKRIPDRDSIPSSSWVTSRFYRAPEIMLGSTHYGTQVDMWSLGVMMTEMFSRADAPRPLFYNYSDRAQLLQVLTLCGAPTAREASDMRVPQQWVEELAAVHDVLDAPLALRTVLHSAQIHMPPDLEDLCIDLLHLAPSDRPTAVKAVHRALGTSEGRADRRDRLCAALRATFAPNRGT